MALEPESGAKARTSRPVRLDIRRVWAGWCSGPSGKWSYAVYDGFTWYGHAQDSDGGRVGVDSRRRAGPSVFSKWPVIASGAGSGRRRDGGPHVAVASRFRTAAAVQA